MESSGWIWEKYFCMICGRSWRDKLLRFDGLNETYIWCPFCRNITGIVSRLEDEDEEED